MIKGDEMLFLSEAANVGFLDDMDSRDMALYVKENALQLFEDELEGEEIELRIGYLMCSLIIYAYKKGLGVHECFERAQLSYFQEN